MCFWFLMILVQFWSNYFVINIFPPKPCEGIKSFLPNLWRSKKIDYPINFSWVPTLSTNDEHSLNQLRPESSCFLNKSKAVKVFDCILKRTAGSSLKPTTKSTYIFSYQDCLLFQYIFSAYRVYNKVDASPQRQKNDAAKASRFSEKELENVWEPTHPSVKMSLKHLPPETYERIENIDQHLTRRRMTEEKGTGDLSCSCFLLHMAVWMNWFSGARAEHLLT